MAHHAGTDRRSRGAYFCKEPAVRRLCDPPENLVTDTGRMFGDVPELNTELFLCIVVFKLLLKPQS